MAGQIKITGEIDGEVSTGRKIGWVCLVLVCLASGLLPATGCTHKNEDSVLRANLAATLVPDLDIDLYMYIKQEQAIEIPGEWMDVETDPDISSISIWQIIEGEEFSIGTAVNFVTAENARTVFESIPDNEELWSQLSDSTIYMVYGQGVPLESLKTAIANRNFKTFDDEKALNEVARLPDSDSHRAVMVAIGKLSTEVVDMVKQYTGSEMSGTLKEMYSTVKARNLTIGLYTAQPISPSKILESIQKDNIWNMNFGMVVSISSAYPGLIFDPLAERYLSKQGFTEMKLDDTRVFKTEIQSIPDQKLPVLINVSGNHIFAAVASQLEYSQELLSEVQ